MIIFRYLAKEILSVLSAVTLVLLLIFLSNQLIRYFSYAASGKLAANILMQLLMLEVPYLLALLLPLSLFVGIIVAYGRLYVDNEMTVLHACGMGISKTFAVALSVAAVVMVLTGILMLWINPYIALQKNQLMQQGMAKSDLLGTMQPGRFQEANDGRQVVFVERISRDHQKAQNIFIAEQVTHDNTPADAAASWVIISANQGYQMLDPKTNDHFLVADQGYRYSGVPGHNDYTVVKFKTYGVRFEQKHIDLSKPEEAGKSSLNLWQNYASKNSAAELQWRLALPVSVPLLAVLAVLLAKVGPRQGRYLRLLPALLIYVVYANMLFVGRNWIEQGTLPASMGMWLIHSILVVLIIGIMVNRSRWRFKRLFAA